MMKLAIKPTQAFLAVAVSIIVLAFLLALPAVVHPAFQPAQYGNHQHVNTIQLKHDLLDCMGGIGCN